MTLAERIDAAIEEAERMEECFTKLELSAYARGSYRVASGYADTAAHYSERVMGLLKLKHDDGKEESK